MFIDNPDREVIIDFLKDPKLMAALG
jgi:hypothetical protein